MSFSTKNNVRIVTAASLFDGHDAAINIMRRIMQSKGVEIIHLGHNRSVKEIVEAAIEEDAQGIAITSYQGGHVEFFKYMKDLLVENGCKHIKIFGGGGGTILPSEIEELHKYGITKIYSPDDGRHMGLEGMIEDVISSCDFSLKGNGQYKQAMTLGEVKDVRTIARKITNAENGVETKLTKSSQTNTIPVLGITGTGGAGKSSVTDEIVRRFLNNFTDKTIAVISVDPSKKKTGGALLGDRIRMNSISHGRAYMRSLATRDDNTALSSYVQEAIDICKEANFDFIILESAGVGQSDASILDYCDVSMYVMTPEYGAASQLEKINMLDYADVVCVNKFDLIYAGAQKNIGAAGVNIVVINKNCLGKVKRNIPTILDYRNQIKEGSMLNTPPVFAIYVCMLTLRWLKEQGGVDAIEKINNEKATTLYSEIDANPLFKGTVAVEDRSKMNVCFVMDNVEIEERFLQYVKENDIYGIKGHRSVGGFRASLYNALPLESVNYLVELMNDFAQKNA